MDATALTQEHAPHKHEVRRRSERAFPAVLIISLLALSSCAAFAVIMTNGPDYRAAADPAPTPVISGGTDAMVGGSEADKTLEPLTFSVSMPDGPVVIGEPGMLVVVVDNPHEHAIRLDSLDVEVGEPTGDGCRAEWFTVGEYDPAVDGAITVPPNESARIRLPYTLVDLVGTNQDGCKGAKFPLSITGSGRPV